MKTIVITGVSTGIGKAIVAELLKKHENIYLIGMGRSNNEIVHPNYKFIKMDLAHKESILSAVKEIHEFNIDVLICNAGVGYRGTIEDLDINDIKQQFEVNYFGPIILLKEILPKIKKESGKIINIGALGSLITVPTFGYYNVSKLALSKTLEIFEKESGYDTYNIYLGAVKSNFGKNIVETVDVEKSKYKNLYSEWESRFKNFFVKRAKADDVAILVDAIVFNNKKNRFLMKRDHIIALSKVFLPSWAHQKIIDHYYYV